MPMDKPRYPANWEQIAFAVKENANWVCQVCGKQCRKPGEPFDTHKRTLTVAHLNHTPEDVSPENLMAMCAPCHLRYDAKHHAETRRRKMTQDDIKNRFTYHSPSDDQISRYDEIRRFAKIFAELIDKDCPDSREKSLALTKLDEVVMWANASIARNE